MDKINWSFCLFRLAVRSAKSTINPSDINATRQQEQEENFGSFYSHTASQASLRHLTSSMASVHSQGYTSDYGHSRASLRSHKRRKSSAHRLPSTTHIVKHIVSRSMPYLNAGSRPESAKNSSTSPSGKNNASTLSTPSYGHRRQKSDPLTSAEMYHMEAMKDSIDVWCIMFCMCSAFFGKKLFSFLESRFAKLLWYGYMCIL
jgi:hypothetical protein